MGPLVSVAGELITLLNLTKTMYANKTILRCALIGDGFSVVNGRILASIWGASRLQLKGSGEAYHGNFTVSN